LLIRKFENENLGVLHEHILVESKKVHRLTFASFVVIYVLLIYISYLFIIFL